MVTNNELHRSCKMFFINEHGTATPLILFDMRWILAL